MSTQLMDSPSVLEHVEESTQGDEANGCEFPHESVPVGAEQPPACTVEVVAMAWTLCGAPPVLVCQAALGFIVRATNDPTLRCVGCLQSGIRRGVSECWHWMSL